MNKTWQIKVRYHFSNTRILASIIFHTNCGLRIVERLNTERLQNLCY